MSTYCSAQEEVELSKEVGVSILTPLVFALGGYHDIPSFSFFYKKDKGKGAWRLYLNLKRDLDGLDYSGNPYRIYKSFVQRSTDTSEYRIENFYSEGAYKWLSLGYEFRTGKRVQVIYGMDLCVGIRKGDMLQFSSYYEDQTNYYSWGTFTDSLSWRSSGETGRTDASFKYIGLSGFVGIRIPIMVRFVLTAQTGIDYYFNVGRYDYVDGSGQTREDYFQFFSTHTDRVLNEIAISYKFAHLNWPKPKRARITE